LAVPVYEDLIYGTSQPTPKPALLGMCLKPPNGYEPDAIMAASSGYAMLEAALMFLLVGYVLVIRCAGCDELGLIYIKYT